MYGIDVGINYSKMNELSKLVQTLSGTNVPRTSRPFIGEGAYTIESGVRQDGTDRPLKRIRRPSSRFMPISRSRGAKVVMGKKRRNG